MKATVQRFGDRLALTISQEALKTLGLAEGAEVDLVINGGANGLPDLGGPTLAELLEKVTPETLHGEWDTGRPVGKEIW